MGGEELPDGLGGVQLVRRRVALLEEGAAAGPLVFAAVDGDQFDAALVGAGGGRCGERGVGRDIGCAAPIGLEPERVDVGDRRPVDGAPALPTVIGDQLVGGAVDVDHRRRVWRGTGVEHGGRIRADGREDAAVAGQRVAHDAAVADPGGINAQLVDRQVGADLPDHRGDEADVVDILPHSLAAAAVPVPAPPDTVGIGDDELRRIGQLIPAIGVFGLLTGAGRPVQHDHQRCRRRKARGLVDPVGAVQPAERHGMQRWCREGVVFRPDAHRNIPTARAARRAAR